MHDKNGNSIAVGDSVTLTGTVSQTTPGANMCNVAIQTPSGRTYCLTAADVEKGGSCECGEGCDCKKAPE